MKKVKLKYTKQGYSYIQCTREDCIAWGGMSICDDCGNDMLGNEIYLIFILGRAFCKKCFEDWQERAIRYTEDLQLQRERHIEYYKAYGFEVEED